MQILGINQMPRFLLSAAAALLLIGMTASCGEKLPKDPGLLYQDLGVGLTLGMPEDDTSDIRAPKGLELTVTTGEQYASSNPYTDRSAGDDLLVAIYSSEGEQLFKNGATVIDPVLTIKGFPRESGTSLIQLFGKDAGELTPAGVMTLLGPPASKTESNDGSTHLTYNFESDDLLRRTITATFSHRSSGRCYAFEIGLALRQ